MGTLLHISSVILGLNIIMGTLFQPKITPNTTAINHQKLIEIVFNLVLIKRPMHIMLGQFITISRTHLFKLLCPRIGGVP